MTDVNIHSLKALAVFKTVFETGTASQAARTLNLTQSGVSRSLAQLESNLGIELFLREKNRLLATPEAQELYEEILRLMGNIEELRHSVLALKEFGASRLRLVAIPGLSFGLVPQLIAKLLQRNADLNISFDVMSSHDVLRNVESGQADIGFVTLPVATRALRVEQWLNSLAVCLIPAGHRLAERREIELRDLEGQHLVIGNQPNVGTDPLLNLTVQHGVRIAGKTEANIGAITALVASGVGLSVMNSVTAHDQVARSETVTIRPFKPDIAFEFGLVYRDNWMNSAALSFIRTHPQVLANTGNGRRA